MCIIRWILLMLRDRVKRKKPLDYVTYAVIDCPSPKGKARDLRPVDSASHPFHGRLILPSPVDCSK
jgi:hypothetical protein